MDQIRASVRIGNRAALALGGLLLVLLGRAYADEPGPVPGVPSTPVRMDPARPVKVGQADYPEESRRSGEQGRCIVRIRVDRAGDVHDPQLVTSSGFPRLDAACLSALNSAHLIPATQNGAPIETTVDIPINWMMRPPPIAAGTAMFAGYPLMDTIRISASITDDAVVPGARGDTGAAKFYRADNCYVLVRVRRTGQIQAAQVVKSTGSLRLDDACVRSVFDAKLVPAREHGVSIDTWRIVPLEWHFTLDKPRNVDLSPGEPIAVPAPYQALRLDAAAGGALLMKDAMCVVHVDVSASGHTEHVSLTRSTGSPALDQECTDAAAGLKFLAAQRGGEAVAGSTKLWIQMAGSNKESDPAAETPSSAPVPAETSMPSPELLQALQLQGQSLAGEKAAGSAVRVSCLLSVWYAGDGIVRAVQLIRAAGLPKVDQACLQAAIGQRIETPASNRGFGGATQLPITWLFDRQAADSPHAAITPDPTIPAIVTVGSLHPLPEYPPAALAQHAEGVCTMHVVVTANGLVSSLTITQSTGSRELDQVCKDAIYGSAFVPATDGVQRIDGATEVAIDWRLPSPDTLSSP